MGAMPRTDAYVQCRLVQQQRKDAARADIGNRMRNAGQQMQSLDQPIQSEPMPFPRRTTCQTWRNGSITCQEGL
jgi:hypothetical protein